MPSQTLNALAAHPFGKAFLAWKKAGLSVALMRGTPEDCWQKDEVDMLLSPQEAAQAAKILQEQGWEQLDRGLFQPGRQHFLLYQDGRFLKFDMFSAVLADNLQYLDSGTFLQHCTPHESGIVLPDPACWLFHVIVNTVLEKDVLGESYRERVGHLLADQTVLQAAQQLANAAGGLAFLFQPDSLNWLLQPEALAGQRARVRDILTQQPLNCRRIRRTRLLMKFGKTLGLRRGFTLCVIGPDGAGKTTFVTAMEALLNEHGIRTGKAYMGPWEYPALPTSVFLRRLGASPLDFNMTTNPDLKRFSKLLKARVRRLLYYANFLPEMWGRYFTRVLPPLQERRVVLYDRSAVDLVVGYYNEPMTNFAWLRHLLVRFSPRANLSILLDNDAELIWSRKKEFPLELIQSSLSLYRAMASRYGLEVVRTDQDPQTLVRQVLERHWRDFVRWRQEGWFR